MRLGQKIREIRIAKGLTQSQLGVGLVTPSMISQIESGKASPSFKVLEAIAERLETPLEKFLTEVDLQLEQNSLIKVATAYLESGTYKPAIELLTPLLDDPLATPNQDVIRLLLGEGYLQKEDFDQADELLQEALTIFRKKEDLHGAIRTLHKLGTLESKRQKYHVAVYHWLQATNLFQQQTCPDPFVQSAVLLDLGAIYTQYGDDRQALSYYEEAQRLLADTAYFDKIAEVNLALANSWINMGDFQKALAYAEQSVALYEANKNIKTSIDLKGKIADLKVRQHQWSEALSLLAECREAYRRYHFEVEEMATLGELARVHLLQGRADVCRRLCEESLSQLPSRSVEAAIVTRTLALALVELGQTNEAVKLLRKAIDILQGHRRIDELADTYSALANVYEKSGAFPQSVEALQSMKACMEQGLEERGIVL